MFEIDTTYGSFAVRLLRAPDADGHVALRFGSVAGIAIGQEDYRVVAEVPLVPSPEVRFRIHSFVDHSVPDRLIPAIVARLQEIEERLAQELIAFCASDASTITRILMDGLAWELAPANRAGADHRVRARTAAVESAARDLAGAQEKLRTAEADLSTARSTRSYVQARLDQLTPATSTPILPVASPTPPTEGDHAVTDGRPQTGSPLALVAHTKYGTFRVVEFCRDARSELTFLPIDGREGDTTVPSGARYRVRIHLTLMDGVYRARPGEEFGYVKHLQSNDVWVFRKNWRSRVTLDWLVANVVAEATDWVVSHHSEVVAAIQSGIRSTKATARNYHTVMSEAEAGPSDETRVRRATIFRERHAAQESLLREYARFIGPSPA